MPALVPQKQSLGWGSGGRGFVRTIPRKKTGEMWRLRLEGKGGCQAVSQVTAKSQGEAPQKMQVVPQLCPLQGRDAGVSITLYTPHIRHWLVKGRPGGVWLQIPGALSALAKRPAARGHRCDSCCVWGLPLAGLVKDRTLMVSQTRWGKLQGP